MMTLQECADASIAAFRMVYEAIEADKAFPEHLPIEAYISCHTETMKLYMTAIINEAKGKSFNKPQYDKPKQEQQSGQTGQYNQCTEKQSKAVFVITHTKEGGNWQRNNKFKELETYGIINKEEIKNMSYKDASAFIEKFGGN